MKLTPAGLLPLSNRGIGDAGVNENWLVLFMLHALCIAALSCAELS
jgi:hypothetical protein